LRQGYLPKSAAEPRAQRPVAGVDAPLDLMILA
jgi:hypothetical protein